jgi:hypothetical protein
LEFEVIVARDVMNAVSKQYEVVMTGDVALAREAVAPDFTNEEAGAEPPACARLGPAGLLATGAWLRLALSELRIEESVTVADEHHVLSVVTLTGRHTGPFTQFADGKPARVIPPTGREIAVRQAHVHGLRDGAVVSHSAVRDDLGMLGQLGVVPPNPALLARMAMWTLTGKAARAGRTAVAVTEAAAAAADASADGWSRR